MAVLSLLSVLAATSGALAQFSFLPPVTTSYPNITSCLDQPSFYSCENTTTIQNTCCSPTPGGLVLATQFWSTYTGLESEGQLLPKRSWTIHGLWPDNCDGSYNSYCDLSRQYDPTPSPAVLPGNITVPPYTGPPVSTFLTDFGRYDLLTYMNTYWINQGAPNWYFWGHEFSKHATCTSTFDVACYGPDYKKHEDVINFYDSVIRAFKQYPTYDMLAAYGITPSNKTTYSYDKIINALQSQTGAIPYLGCYNNGTVLEEVWYFSHVYGTEQYGHFKNINSTTTSYCGPEVWYYERTPTSEREVQ